MSHMSHWWCDCLKILKQAWIFPASHTITLAGLCIHRKAINIDKQPVLWISGLPRIRRIMRICLWEKNRSKSLLLSLGLRHCSQVGMFIHASKFACLNLPICLVCPAGRQKATKQNSCRWQYKMSLYQRLLTITLDLRGVCPQDFSS